MSQSAGAALRKQAVTPQSYERLAWAELGLAPAWAQHRGSVGDVVSEQLAARFRRFAEVEARGSSPLYEAFALGVAADAWALEFLGALPDDKRQPNLLFAALRHVCGTPADWPMFRMMLREHAAETRGTMLERRTQTNEPGRCATLLPVLARLPQPLALLEVGAAAGLCLLPDRYGYDFGRRFLAPPTADAPVFPCSVSAEPIPRQHLEVVWRLGLDLHPLDVTNNDDTAWLETLVWPEHTARLQRLRAALEISRRDPPNVVQGDLLQDLASCVQRAPAEATLVIFHSAVLAYLGDAALREEFARAVRRTRAVWVSNEAPNVLRSITARRGLRGAFLLSVDGLPQAWTDPHGRWIEWINAQENRG